MSSKEETVKILLKYECTLGFKTISGRLFTAGEIVECISASVLHRIVLEYGDPKFNLLEYKTLGDPPIKAVLK